MAVAQKLGMKLERQAKHWENSVNVFSVSGDEWKVGTSMKIEDLQAGDYVKLFQPEETLLHEGLLENWSGTFSPIKINQSRHSFLFKNLATGGISLSVPFVVEMDDGIRIRAE